MKPQSCKAKLAIERPKFEKLTGHTRIKFTQEQLDAIVSRYNAGESCYSISKLYNVDSDTIRRRLLILGINTRSLSESNILQGTDKICQVCGKQFRFKLLDSRHTKTCSKECLSLLKSRNNWRNNHPMWNGGTTRYRDIAYSDLKLEKICDLCGSTEKLVVHHIDQNHTNSNRENLQILCRSCHLKVHATIKRGEM